MSITNRRLPSPVSEGPVTRTAKRRRETALSPGAFFIFHLPMGQITWYSFSSFSMSAPMALARAL